MAQGVVDATIPLEVGIGRGEDQLSPAIENEDVEIVGDEIGDGKEVCIGIHCRTGPESIGCFNNGLTIIEYFYLVGGYAAKRVGQIDTVQTFAIGGEDLLRKAEGQLIFEPGIFNEETWIEINFAGARIGILGVVTDHRPVRQFANGQRCTIDD